MSAAHDASVRCFANRTRTTLRLARLTLVAQLATAFPRLQAAAAARLTATGAAHTDDIAPTGSVQLSADNAGTVARHYDLCQRVRRDAT